VRFSAGLAALLVTLAPGLSRADTRYVHAGSLIDTEIRLIETHLRRTFGADKIALKARPKQKDSAEVYIGDEFIGVVYQDEDEDGSFMFEMAILSEDLNQA
jgi:hypothetical protein